MDSKIATALLDAVAAAALDAALLGKADASALASLLSTVDGLDTPLEYATNAALSATSTQSSRSSPPCSFPAAAELLTRRPGRASRLGELVRGSNVVRNLHLGAPLSAALANGDDMLSITADCYSTAGTDSAITAALLAYYTSSQVDTLLGDYRTGTAQDAETAGAITTALLAYYTSSQVDALLGDYRTASAQDTQTQAAIAGALLAYGPGPGRVHHQPNHLGAGGVPFGRGPGHGNGLEHRSRAAQLLHHRTSRRPPCWQAREVASVLQIAVRFPDDGEADEVVAAIGEQILGPTDVSLSNWTVRPSSGCSVVLATHTVGAVSVDGYTLTLAVNPWNIVRTYNLTPGRELLFACRYRLGTASNFVVYMSEADNVYDPLYGSFVGDQGAWSTAKMYFTVPPNGVAKLHF